MFLLTTGLAIAGICLILAIFSVVNQSLEQKRAERRRVSAGLERHAAHYQYLLTTFPQGYLSKELEIFILHTIIDTYAKLSHIDSRHKINLQKYRQAQKDLIQTPENSLERIALITPQQIKEAKQHIKDLLSGIANALQNHSITSVQANQFKQYLSNILLGINLDSFQMAAQQAEQSDKLQVAIHYHEQAKKLVMANSVSNGMTPENKQRIARYDQTIKALSDKLARQTSTLIVKSLENTNNVDPIGHPSTHNHEQLDPFKKKQIYD